MKLRVNFIDWLFNPKGKTHGTHRIGDWMGPGAGLHILEEKNLQLVPETPTLSVKPVAWSLD